MNTTVPVRSRGARSSRRGAASARKRRRAWSPQQLEEPEKPKKARKKAFSAVKASANRARWRRLGDFAAPSLSTSAETAAQGFEAIASTKASVAAATLRHDEAAMVKYMSCSTKSPQFPLPVSFLVGSRENFSSLSEAEDAKDVAVASCAAPLGKLWQADIPLGWWCETFEFLTPRDTAKIMRDCKSFYTAGRWRFREKSLFVPRDVPSLRSAFDEISHLCTMPKPITMISKIRLAGGMHTLPETNTPSMAMRWGRIGTSEKPTITVSGERRVDLGFGVGGDLRTVGEDLQTTIVGTVSLNEPFSRFVFKDLCFTNEASSAIHVKCNSTVEVRNCLIRECGDCGIEASNGAQVSVVDSTIQSCDNDGIKCSGEGTRVKLCDVHISDTYDAVWCRNGSEVEVCGSSVLHHNASNAFRIDGSSSIVVIATNNCHAYENEQGNIRFENGGEINHVKHAARLIEMEPSLGT